MKKFLTIALAESFVFSLCFTGITALLRYFVNDRMTNEEVLLSLPLAFVGWFIWQIIRFYILKKK